MERMIMLARVIATTTLVTNFIQVLNWIRESAKPPMIAPEVGVKRLTAPLAAAKIITITAGLKLRFWARGPMIGMETVAIPEVEGMRKDRKK